MPNFRLAAFQKKFLVRELEVKRLAGWILSVRPGQLTLGAMVLSSESGLGELAALGANDGAGLATGLSIAERLARDVYGAVRVNAMCLMMKDPIVHFHIFPRYDRNVQRYGRTWSDPYWPRPLEIHSATEDPELLLSICGELHDAARGMAQLANAAEGRDEYS